MNIFQYRSAKRKLALAGYKAKLKAEVAAKKEEVKLVKLQKEREKILSDKFKEQQKRKETIKKHFSKILNARTKPIILGTKYRDRKMNVNWGKEFILDA